jgi:hypothetical protein
LRVQLFHCAFQLGDAVEQPQNKFGFVEHREHVTEGLCRACENHG